MTNWFDIVGWDVGGAHLKIAALDKTHTLCAVQQHYTPIWQGLQVLDEPLATISANCHTHTQHVITMTAELVDLFSNRSEGIVQITDYLRARLGPQMKLYAGPEGLLAYQYGQTHAALIASANWHATTQYVAQQLVHGMLFDMGSSTTDLIPFVNANCAARGYTDQTRMQERELCYSGLLRTPVMAVVQHVPFAGNWQAVVAEHFATMADVYRLLGAIDTTQDTTTTADGRDKSILSSCQRLARMLGTDAVQMEPKWHALAQFIAQKQQQQIADNLIYLLHNHPATADGTLVGAGIGRPIAQRLAKKLHLTYSDFASLLDCPPALASAAADNTAAVALALCARELCG